MNSLQQIYQIQNILQKEYFAVAYPDHPFLLTGPDMLISHQGKIIALFIKKRYESCNSLIYRLALSRIALPNHTLCVLGISDYYSYSLPNNMIRDFDEILRLDSLKELKFYIKKPGDQKVNKTDLFRVKHKAQLMSSEILHYSEIVKRLHIKARISIPKYTEILEEYDQAVMYKKVISDMRDIPNNNFKIFNFHELYVILLRLRKQKLQQLKINSLLYKSMKYSYMIDSGIPYRTFHEPFFVITDTMPSMRYDNEKPIRASSLIGISYTLPTAEDEFIKISEKLQKKLKRLEVL